MILLGAFGGGFAQVAASTLRAMWAKLPPVQPQGGFILQGALAAKSQY